MQLLLINEFPVVKNESNLQTLVAINFSIIVKKAIQINRMNDKILRSIKFFLA